jgi:hypothetical protein
MAAGEVNAMTEGRYRLIGSTASPYAIKLRALLRYRRIPFDWVIMTKALRKATEHLRPNLIPALQYPDGTYRGETTALAYRSCSDACSNSGRANSFLKVDRRPSWGQRPAACVLPSKRSRAV